MKKISFALIIAATSMPLQLAHAADALHQAEVAERGKHVMPFRLNATTHVFTKTAQGGTQKVIVKNIAHADQTNLIRVHLQKISRQFAIGDFSGPSRIHGMNMPGLDELRSAQRGEIAVDYRDIEGGAELAYRTSTPGMAAALHKWFDAQLSDHGDDAMQGHRHHHQRAK